MKKVTIVFLFILLVSVFIQCKSQKESMELPTVMATDDVSLGEHKNILFIAIDDLKPLINAYGESQMITPNMDRLASMGVAFTNAHVQQAVCGPSRASIMTGMYPDHTKVWDLETNFRESAPWLISMPEYLIENGYETTAVGKIYHKGSSSPGHDGDSWSIPHTIPYNKYDPANGVPAFHYYQDPGTKRKMDELMAQKGDKKDLRNYVLERLKPSTESCDVSDDSYQDGVYTTEALRKLDQLLAIEKPFFLGVGYQKPHLPFVAPKKYWDLYEREDIELAAFQELAEGTPKLAYHNFGELRSYTDIDNDLDIGDKLPEAKQRELVHGYMACVSYIDAQVGKLLDALEEKGILDNTLIVLWGDHGFHLGDHAEWCKHSNFEQATRIPLIFAGPGIAQREMIDHPVELVDVFPSLFDLAHVPIPNHLDGKSLLPLLDGNASSSIDMDFTVSQFPRGNDRMGYTIRTDRYRYTEWHGNNYRSYHDYKDENIMGRELYDYQIDALETKNLVEESEYRSIAIQLKGKLKQHLEQTGKPVSLD